MTSELIYETSPLGDLVEFENGDRGKNYPSPTDYVDRGIPFVGAANIVDGNIDWESSKQITESAYDRLNSGKVRPGDLIYCLRGTLGKVSRSTGLMRAAIASSLVLMRPKADADAEYLYYVLSSPLGEQLATELDNGSVQPNLSVRAVSGMEIPSPPPPIQRAIAHILGTLDDKIELNRRKNATLEAIARAIFKSWFVDFDPVRAKAEGRDPGLPAHIADLFPDHLVDSELGEIPEGWGYMPVGEAVEAVGGATPSTKNPAFWEDGYIPWATPKDLSGLEAPILVDTGRKITDKGLSTISSGLLPAGTVLLSSRAPVGYLAISTVPTAINQGFIAMKCDGPVSNFFMLNWCHFTMEVIKQRASGTTFAEISKKAFRPIPVLVPPLDTVHAFDSLVEALYESIYANIEESETLSSIRDTLLPKLMSGELRVEDPDTFLERLA